MKNKQMQRLIERFKEKGSVESIPLLKRIAEELEKPTRRRRIVNLVSIDRYATEEDLVVVPGKVLANGELTHKVRVVAQSFSGSAKDKIISAKGEAITFEEFLNTNIKGQKIKILG